MNWQWARQIFATWGWLILAAAGLFIGGGGVFIGIRSTSGFADPWAAIPLGFSQAILSAGMVTGVIRAAQQAGFFKDQLREVIYRENLTGSLIDAKGAWRSLTRGLFRQRFASLTDSALESVSVDSLIGSAEYFYEAHWRQIDIDWFDRSKYLLKITETVNATLITADIGREIPFANVYEPEADESARREINYELNDGKALSVKLTQGDVTTRVDGRQELVVNLPPRSNVTLKRTTTKVQELRSDPFLNFRSTCLLSNPEIVVATPAGSGLAFYFRPMGVQAPYAAKDGSDIEGRLTSLNAQCKALCLPNQGYMIVIVSTI